MPEIISTPNALVQTTNGKRFYAFSGELDVTTTETSMIDIANIGERDIKLALEIGCSTFTSDNIEFKVYNNGILIYNNEHGASSSNLFGYNEFKVILPANTSLKVTLRMGGTTVAMTVTAYGKYLSM